MRASIFCRKQHKGIATAAIGICEAFSPHSAKWSLDFSSDQLVDKKCYEEAGYRDTGIREKKR